MVLPALMYANQDARFSSNCRTVIKVVEEGGLASAALVIANLFGWRAWQESLGWDRDAARSCFPAGLVRAEPSPRLFSAVCPRFSV